ncbi:peptide chain release factor N(5)-glutamine methyltransferase [Virgibacillus byunsanensis]|uniref:Release factor glutamine methyltransferase n=1 Tax=Virgibacillus byunsanensis TaxID=570945 RepID=A0ABW3LHG4_9BACI
MNKMDESMKQYEVLEWASLFLEKHNRETKVAEVLLQHYLDVSRSTFFTMMRERVSASVQQQFEEAIKTHAETGKPVQHITGYEYFYGRKFHVNENVLIPRPETEELVQFVIESTLQNNPDQPVTIVDIGTGSGVIAITLALELKNATVYATDISEKALDTAKNNAASLGASVHFLQGDFLKPVIKHRITADWIVSNPPYIARADEPSLADTVKTFDPELALFAEENGLAAYQQIIADLPDVVKPYSHAAFEIGFEQGESVSTLLKKIYPNSRVTISQDINKKDRIVSAELV